MLGEAAISATPLGHPEVGGLGGRMGNEPLDGQRPSVIAKVGGEASLEVSATLVLPTTVSAMASSTSAGSPFRRLAAFKWGKTYICSHVRCASGDIAAHSAAQAARA